MKKICKAFIKFFVAIFVAFTTIAIANSIVSKAANVSGKLNVTFTVVDYDKYIAVVDKYKAADTQIAQVEAMNAGMAEMLWNMMYASTYSSLGSTIAEIKANKASELSTAQKDTFTPSTSSETKYFGVLYEIQSDTKLLNVAIGTQYSKISSSVSGAGPLSNACTKETLSKTDITIPSGASLTTANSFVNGDNIATIGNYSTNSAGGLDVTSSTILSVVKVPISTTANGTYTLGLADTSDVIGHFIGGSEFKKGSNSNFNVNAATVTIQGASSDTTTTFTSGTSAASATTAAASIDHTALTAKMAEVSASASTAYLTGVVAASGKMPASVKYATTVAGLATGTTVSETSTGSGIYAIPMSCDTGKSMYVSVVVTASDNTTQKTYTVEIPRGKYTVAALTGLSISESGTALDLYASSTATSATTFSATTYAYTIKLKSNQTSFSITPTWDTTKNQTCKIITSDNTSGATHSTSGSAATYTHTDATDIIVRMKSEDGSTTQDYTIHVYRESDDVTLSLFSYGASASSLTNATLDSGTHYTGTVALGTTATYFKFIPTSSKATLEYSFEDTSTPGSRSSYTSGSVQNCIFSSGTGGATMYIHVYVTSESGLNTEEYILTVTRDAGSSETGINGINVSYNGASYVAATLQSDGSYKVETPFTFTNLTNDKFKFKVNQITSEVGKQTIQYAYSTAPTTYYGYTTVSSDIAFSSYAEETITIIIKVQAQDSSVTPVQYNLSVTRAKASDNVTLSDVSIAYQTSSFTSLSLQPDGETYTKSGLAFGAYAGDSFKIKFTQGESGQTFAYTSDDKNATAGVGTSGSAITFVFADSYLTQTVTVNLTVTALDNSTTKTYNIVITRDGASSETGINGLVIGYNGTNQTPVQTSDTYKVENMLFTDKTGDYFTFKVTKKESGQTISFTADDAASSANTNLTSGTEVRIYFSTYAAETITVTVNILAADRNANKDYTIIVSRKAASNDSALDTSAFKVYKVDDTLTKTALTGSFTGDTYNLTNSTLDYASYGTGSKIINAGVGFDVKIPAYSKVSITSDNSQNFDYDNSSSATASTVQYLGNFTFVVKTAITVNYTITVTAQDSSTSEYHVQVSRNAANDDYSGITIKAYSTDGLKSYVIKSPTSILNNQLLYETSVTNLPYAVKDLNIVIESSVSTTKVYYSGADITGSTTEIYSITDNIVKTASINNASFEFTVFTEADDATSTGRTLKIIYSRDAANSENSINLSKVTLADDLGNEYALSSATVSGKTYSFLLDSRKGMTEYYIKGVENSTTTSLATIYAMDGTATGYTASDLYNESDPHTIGTGNTTYIIVVSEAETPNTYTFNVGFSEILDDNPKISNIAIAELDATAYEWTTALASATTDQTINITLPYSIKQLTITPTLASTKASFAKDERVAALNIPVGNTTYKFQGKAQDGTLGVVYTFNVTRTAGNEDNLMTKLTIGSTAIINGTATLPSGYTQDSNEIHHLVSTSTSNIRLAYEVSPNAIVDIRVAGASTGSDSNTTFNTSLTSGAKNEIIMRITSEKDYYDGNTSSYNEYHIYIYPASDDLKVDSITAYVDNSLADLLLDSNGNQIVYDFDGAQLQTFNIPYSAKQAYIDVALPLNLDGVMDVSTTSRGTISSAGITYTIVAKSQYATLNTANLGKTKTYQIKLIQDAASTENRLADLQVKIVDGTEVKNLITGFDKDKNNYACENISASITQVTVAYELVSPNHSKVTAGSNVGTISVDLTNNSRTLAITVLNELDQENTYYVVLTTGEVNWATNATITDIKALVDSKNIIQTFENTNQTYSGTVRAAVSEVVFHVATYAPTATVTINGTAMDSSTSNTLNTYTATIEKGKKNTFEFVCTAQDGTTKSIAYTIDITSVAADTVSTLKVFNVNGTDVSDGDVLNVGVDVDSVAVLVQPDSAHATLSQYENPTELNYGENIISVTCTAEDNTYKTYTIKVIRDYPAELSNIVVYKKDDATKTNLINVDGSVADSYTLATFPYEYGDCELVVEATSDSGDNVTISGTGDWVITETGKQVEREITVTAASGFTKTYKLIAERNNGSNENLITSYKVSATDTDDLSTFSPNNSQISYYVGRDVTYYAPVIETSEKALVNPVTSKQYFLYNAKGTEITSDNPSLAVGKNEFTIKVYSETHVVNEYTVTVYRAENEKGFTNIDVFTNATNGETVTNTTTGTVYDYADFALDGSNYAQTINVAYKQSQVYLKFAVNGTYAKVYVNGSEFTKEEEAGLTVYQGFVKLNNVGTTANVINMYTISELGSYTTEFGGVTSETYSLTIYREELNSDAKLKDLQVLVGGVNKVASFDPDTLEYLVNEVGSVTQIEISATPNATSTTVSGTGNRNLSDQDVNFYSYTVTATAENGDKLDYVIKVSRTAMTEDEANNDNSLSFIVIDNSNNNVMSPSFNATTLAYTVTIPYTAQSYIIKLSTNSGSKAKTYVDSELVDGMKQFTASSRTNTSHTVYAMSATNKKGTEYLINVVFEVPSSNTNLISLIANDQQLYVADTYAFKANKQDSDVEKVVITAIAEDSKTVIVGNGSYALTAGEDTIVTITAIAEDGTKQNYTITVPRAAAQPYLIDLKLNGSTLLDPYTSAEVTFNPEVESYLVKVENGSKDTTLLPGTITAQVDNSSYTVTSDNAVKQKSTSSYVNTFSVSLLVGKNTFNITVQSPEDPTNNRVYTLEIERKAPQSSDTSISMLKIVRTNGVSTTTLRENSVLTDSDVLDFEVSNAITSVDVIPTLSSTTATYQIINNKLTVGDNDVIILVTAEDGTKNYTTLNINREDYKFNVSIDEIPEFANDYAKDDIEDSYTVASDISKLNFNVSHTETTNTSKIDLVVLSGSKLSVGENKVEAQIICEGNIYPIEFKVVREDYNYNIASEEIEDLEKDHSAGIKSKYTVSSNVTTVNFNISNSDSSVSEQPTYKVISGEKLNPGDNIVELQITAADGTVSTEKISVHRESMSFNVLETTEKNPNYTCKAKSNSDNVYTIDLGKDGKASDITDYAAFISYDSSTNDLVVTTLTDTTRDDCNEVILLVQTSDGAESKVVKIELESTKTPTASFDIFVWVALIIALILLVIILICVNRDKYGSVSRKRKANQY